MKRRGHHLVVVGAGNIGSILLGLLAHMVDVRAITLIDPDVYTPANLPSQDISAEDIGLPKVVAQERRLRRINPDLRVETLAERVESVPLGRLHGDVVLGAVDSRAARQVVCESAWRSGVPCIDAGIEATGLLARVSIYTPGDATFPCYECAWSERDYGQHQRHTSSCTGGASETTPTRAPLSLGALAASLQAIECGKMLSGEEAGAALGHEILIDCRSHRLMETALRRNPACRFDHRVWRIEQIDRTPESITLGELLNGGAVAKPGDPVSLRHSSRRFVTRTQCAHCGARSSQVALDGRLTTEPCARCGWTMTARGFDVRDQLEVVSLTSQDRERSLRSMGLRRGDVITINCADGSESHIELAGRAG